jgi:XTP/dITP diphosphohydrolase
MQYELIFATNNIHKLQEINNLLGTNFRLLSLSDIGCSDEIPEDKDTLEGNALQKALYIYNKFHMNCFADDTGLEVEALNGRPGVHSARFSEKELPGISGIERSEANIRKLIYAMKDIKNRIAVFRTIICLIEGGEKIFFEGKVEGRLIDKNRGSNGFGYDPVFIPEGFNITYAEMNLEEKNKISHRAMAFTKLIAHLKQK